MAWSMGCCCLSIIVTAKGHHLVYNLLSAVQQLYLATRFLSSCALFYSVQCIVMEEDWVIVSDKMMNITNMHLHVPKGITLTFRAPAINLARDEVKRCINTLTCRDRK